MNAQRSGENCCLTRRDNGNKLVYLYLWKLDFGFGCKNENTNTQHIYSYNSKSVQVCVWLEMKFELVYSHRMANHFSDHKSSEWTLFTALLDASQVGIEYQMSYMLIFNVITIDLIRLFLIFLQL